MNTINLLNKNVGLLSITLVGITSCGFSASEGAGNSNIVQPNIVFVLADDCSYWDIGCYGSKDAITPNIDRLASEGMKFTNFHQAAPMCSPTRHNLYTGIYPVRSGAYPNHTFVDPGTKCIIDYLEPLGYRIALSGKRHISPPEVFRFEYLGNENNPQFDLVDAFLADTKEKNEPFLLFLTSNEPHTPWNLGNPDQFDPESVYMPPFMVRTPETQLAFTQYLAEIEYLDGQVGEAMGLIEKHGLADNTVFIFSSEQGNSFPFAKWTCYDAGLRTAVIVRYPGVVEPGSVTNALVDYTDMVPTFIEIAGGEVPEGLDGNSFLPVLQGQTNEHNKYTFGIQTTRGINFGSEQYAIRSVSDGRYRLINNLNHEDAFQNGLIKRPIDWWASWEEAAKSDLFAKQQVQAYQYRPAVELFDFWDDKYNMSNLADDPRYAGIRNELQLTLDGWMKSCGDLGVETELKAGSRSRRGREE